MPDLVSESQPGSQLEELATTISSIQLKATANVGDYVSISELFHINLVPDFYVSLFS